MKNIIFITIFCVIIGSIITKTQVPVIAIYANMEDLEDDYTKDRVQVNYVRWIESAGGESVLIHTWDSRDRIVEILSKVNGVLFQGGSRYLDLTKPWETNAEFILSEVKKMNDNGIHFPLWGTCQGFELLMSLIHGDRSILTDFNAYNIKSNIIMSRGGRMYENFSDKDIYDLNNKDVTQQFHNLGVSPKDFSDSTGLSNFFNITAYGNDRNGTVYISTVEAIKYPIYGVQHHPEKTPFERNSTLVIPQSVEAIKISQLYGYFFIAEARKSNRTVTEQDKINFHFINTYEQGDKVYDNDYYHYIK